MGRLDRAPAADRERLLRWLLMRQESGFKGRPHKPVDTCYSFWVGSSIHLLGHGDLVNTDANRAYLMTTQNSYGGFSKWVDVMPDPLHTYMALSGLSLQREPGIKPVHPALNFSMAAAARLPFGTGTGSRAPAAKRAAKAAGIGAAAALLTAALVRRCTDLGANESRALCGAAFVVGTLAAWVMVDDPRTPLLRV